jgi:site-specific DNA-methyltransferase (adenine-specific)
LSLQPCFANGLVTLYEGDSLSLLRELPTASVGAVVTDPPYSSGGFTRGDRQQGTAVKYTLNGTAVQRPEFHGDNRDQRGYLAWCSMWMAECLRIVRPGGYLLTFTDWRQLPITTDATQAAGWMWRGIVPWDKTEAAKPQMGWFRAQCEYVLTASHGSMPKEQEREVRICAPGCFRQPVMNARKQHITAKPLPLMKRLMEVVPKGAVVLDPFAGSGTTLLAAYELGYRVIGIELSAEYCAIIKARFSQELLPLV